MDRNKQAYEVLKEGNGQARKSLLIETPPYTSFGKSYLGQARKSLWIETCHTGVQRNELTVRLVRACGSKQNYRDYVPKATPGQARKSLWIETGMMGNIQKESTGQARKSLWIETSRR